MFPVEPDVPGAPAIPPMLPHAGTRAPFETRQETTVQRVLMTADAVGGVWHYVLDLSAGLHMRGVRVTVAVMGPEPTVAQRAAAAAAGVSLIHGPFRLEWMDDPWDDVQRAGEWLLDVERQVEPDVVHINGFCHAALPWQAPVLVAGHSCVRTWWRAVHGSEPPAIWDRYSREVARGLASARLVVAPTRAMLGALQGEYEGMGAARVIPNGRSTAVWQAPPPCAKEAIVFAAGRMWDEAKNIAALCSAASALPWPVYVAGDNCAPDGGPVASGYARHLGRLDGAELRDWFARAAIYALPARYEPFGLSVLEAAAAGCALVLGDVGSLRENWSGAAVFVPPDNRRMLGAALSRLIEDHEERTRLAARAQLRARQFTVDRMVERYLDAYEEIAG